MFEAYEGFLNLDHILQEEYQYTYQGDLQDFYQQPFVEMEGVGVDALCWISYRGQKYLFKPIDDFSYNVWGELLSQEVAREMGISCASYRAASLGNLKGVITKSFIKQNETLILGGEVFQRFLNRNQKLTKDLYQRMEESFKNSEDFDSDITLRQKNFFRYLNNLEYISLILEENPNINNKETESLIDFFEKMLLFDLVTMQKDRHPDNWGIKKSLEESETVHYRPACLFDHANSFGLGMKFMKEKVVSFRSQYFDLLLLKDEKRKKELFHQGFPAFTLSANNTFVDENQENISFSKVLKDYLEKTSEDHYIHFINYINQLDVNFLDKMIKTAEIKNGLMMNPDVYYYISVLFEYHIKQLQHVCNQVQRSNENAVESGRKI